MYACCYEYIMNEIVRTYHEADKVVQFVRSFAQNSRPPSRFTPRKRKATPSRGVTPPRWSSRSRSSSVSSTTTSSSFSTRDDERVLNDMLEEAIDRREAIAVKFFKQLDGSMTEHTLPNMLQDFFCYYGAHKHGWKQNVLDDFAGSR